MEKDHDTTLTRRDLLRGAAYTSLGIALGIEPVRSDAASRRAPLAKVVVVRSKDVLDDAGKPNQAKLEAMLDRGMRELSGEKTVEAAWRSCVNPTDAVGIKISLMMTPTHEELTQAIKERLSRVGVKNAVAWDRDSSKPEQFTAIINVPGMKTHWLSGIGVAIKNYAGCYPRPSTLHGDSCADLGKMWLRPPLKGKTRLVIVDALRVIYHGGPHVDPRYLWDYEGLILGTDPVAVDTVCLSIIQKKRNEVRPPNWIISPPPKHIEVADTKYHLGVSDLARIKVVNVQV